MDNQLQCAYVCDFNERFRQRHETAWHSSLRKRTRRYFSKQYYKQCVQGTFPFVKTLRSYKIKKYLANDVIAGLTVGVMQIPQGMAYALLSSLPPICGLYISFFGPLVYFFLGTSKHVSMGRFGFGIMTTYMPEPMVSGFTSAVAVQIITAQAKYIFGLDIVRYHGYSKIIKTWIAILRNIGGTQWLPLVIFILSFIILYVIKVHINIRYKKKLKIPIPADLIVVVLATVIAYAARLHENDGLNVVKDIPAGFPSMNLPDLRLVIPKYLKDAVMIGIVAFTQTVSIAKILAQTNNYDIDPNQEMVAYGTGSLACSLFSGYIPAGSVGRSMVQEGAGGKTQVASLFGCLVVLVVIVAIGPLFYNLPKCVLSAVVLMSLRGMFLQYLELPSLWRKSKIDFMIWVVTATSTIILDAEIGIIIGIAFSVFTVTLRTQRADGYKAGFVGSTNILKNIQQYQPIQSDDGRVHFIQYHGPVYFANADHFMRTVYKTSELDLKLLRKSKKRLEAMTVTALESTTDEENEKKVLTDNKQKIVIDFTRVNFVDLVGVKAIKRIHSDYKDVGVDVLFVGCNDGVIDMLTSCEAMKDLSSSLFTSMETLISHMDSYKKSVKCDRKELLDNGFPDELQST
ncbi:sulfate transporter-like isoform X2 [Ostrea edulis]|uniref:sulfate transporter-like isoform X2 n=1 Tax=Ostrea edulis TaxID=37623 RepID=UPI0024AFA026|nr:sulfate transporter-like isoform X2 [Ostrea edulis]